MNGVRLEKLCDPAPVRSYRPGGFVFAHGFHYEGPVLILPDGVYAWPVQGEDPVGGDGLDALLDMISGLDFLVLGTGRTQVFPEPELRARFFEAGLGLEVMATDAACRTYNVLLEEERQFAAALIPL